MTWLTIDLEVQNHDWYSSVASPHCPDNYVVAAGWSIDGGEVQHAYFNNKQESVSSTWFKDALQGQRILVSHNSTFELHWLLHNHREVLLDWIEQGGRVFCTQYSEYLLSNQTHQYAKLEDLSVKYRDEGTSEHDVRKLDEVKILWDSGVLTADIDKELLLSYLCDPVHGDIANTRRVCFKQYAELKRRGMWEMFQARMDSLLFNAIATFNGLHVNQEVANENLELQLAAIKDLQDNILQQLPKDMPPELDFSFTSGYHQSALLFGGEIGYKKKVSYEPKKFEKVEALQQADTGEYITLHAYENYLTDHDFPLVRYRSGKNKDKPKVFKIDSDVEKKKWGNFTYKFEGLLDLDKLPAHVAEQYTGKRAEFKGKRTLSCGTPVYSTSGESLDILAKFTDAAKPLHQLATLQKDTGTYYLMERANGKTSGMLQYVEPTSIIHHQLNNCATITSRLSSSKPNFQNLPRTDEDDEGNSKSKVKEMFTSRFGEDGRIVEVDFSALEVVDLAAVSGDKNLLRMLTEGIDMHCYRLTAKLKEPYEDVKRKCKDASDPDNARYSRMRTDIKPRAFAHQYGATAAGISYSTGCSLEEAEEFKAIEFKLFPESNAFPVEHVRPQVEATGMAELPEREFTEGVGWSLYRRGYYQAKSGTCYSFRQYEQWQEGQKVMDYKGTQIANYPIQGESALIVQAACGLVIREFIKRGFFGGLVLPINTVHDAIYLDCATEALAIEAGTLVREIMEGTPKWLAEKIPALKDWAYHTTPFPAVAEYGSNMAEKIHIH